MRLGKWTVGRMSALTLAGLLFTSYPAMGQVIFVDNFNDTSGPAAAQGDGLVDISKYRAPFGGTTGDDFVGRTNFRFTLPTENVSTVAAGSTDGKVAILPLNTFNPSAPGSSFLGTDMITKQNFNVGGGLRMTSRMRVQSGTPAGLVAAPFLYDVSRNLPPLVRDEIDHELLTNNAQSAGPDNTLTNVWNDGDFASGGAPVMISNPAGFDITQFHDYRTDWSPTSVKYYIDNTLVRTETSVVPDDPMRAHWNFWAPDSSFTAAYSAALTPAASGPGATYNVELDKVQLDRYNTTISANLLADPSFELFSGPGPNGTGGWTLFNNAFYETTEVAPQDGFTTVKVYGPFTGGPNASGMFQNVAALPGDEFSASIFAHSPSGDSILGNQNYTNVTLQFVNAGGSVIGSVNFSPGTNQRDTPIFDGRDPNMIQNEWVNYAVDAVAPAGTAYVRFNAFFIQLANQGGAVFFDSPSLVKLTDATPSVPGDFDGDGDVDGRDFLSWQRGVSPTPFSAADLATWQGAYNGGALAAVNAVPEPASVTLLVVLGSLFAIGRGQRAR